MKDLDLDVEKDGPALEPENLVPEKVEETKDKKSGKSKDRALNRNVDASDPNAVATYTVNVYFTGQ